LTSLAISPQAKGQLSLLI